MHTFTEWLPQRTSVRNPSGFQRGAGRVRGDFFLGGSDAQRHDSMLTGRLP